jgi:hypothetical protein
LALLEVPKSDILEVPIWHTNNIQLKILKRKILRFQPTFSKGFNPIKPRPAMNKKKATTRVCVSSETALAHHTDYRLAEVAAMLIEYLAHDVWQIEAALEGRVGERAGAPLGKVVARIHAWGTDPQLLPEIQL